MPCLTGTGFSFDVDQWFSNKSGGIHIVVQFFDDAIIPAGDGDGCLVTLNFTDAVKLRNLIPLLHIPAEQTLYTYGNKDDPNREPVSTEPGSFNQTSGPFYVISVDLSTYHSFTITSMIPSPMSDSLNCTMGPRNTVQQKQKVDLDSWHTDDSQR